MTIKAINEERLFSLLPYFFDEPSKVLIEIAQNASRSGASRLDIAINGNILETTDDGSGTDNPESLFILAESDWSENVEENQMPAGWGLFFLVSISGRITFTSRFGSVSVDCSLYLNDSSYRANILDAVKKEERIEKGFRIKAELRQGVSENILKEEYLQFFPINITVNGNPIPHKHISEGKSWDIETSYLGNQVCVKVDEYFPVSPSHMRSGLLAVWYGMPINGFSHHSCYVAIDIINGSPLTPVLPYRHDIKEDINLERFYDFVKNEAISFCTDFINNYDIEIGKKDYDYKRKFIGCVKVINAIASQDEIDSLNNFYLVIEEMHYYEDTNSCISLDKIVSKGEELPLNSYIEKASFMIGAKVSDFDPEDILLPEGTVQSASIQGNHPPWLVIKNNPLFLKIKAGKTLMKGRFTWYEAESILLKGCPEGERKINVAANIQSSGDGDVFYVTDPADYHEIQDSAFRGKIFYEDGDTYDTQAYLYEKDIEKDISKLKNSLALHDLLGGLQDAGVQIGNIISLRVDRKNNTLFVKTSKGLKRIKFTD